MIGEIEIDDWKALRTLLTRPKDVWTEGPLGQRLLEMKRKGYCTYKRKNASLGTFGLTPEGRAVARS